MTCLWLQQWGLGLTNKFFLVCLLGGGGGLSAAHQVGHASGTEGAGAHKARVRQFLIFPFFQNFVQIYSDSCTVAIYEL